MGHSAIGGKSLMRYGFPESVEEQEESGSWESDEEEEAAGECPTSPVHAYTANKSPKSAAKQSADAQPAPTLPPAARSSGGKRANAADGGEVSFKTPGGHSVRVELVPLVTGDSTSFGSALRNGEKDGKFYVLREPPIDAASLRVPLNPPRTTARSVTKEIVLQRHLASIARTNKAKNLPFQRFGDICGFLLWVPMAKNKAPSLGHRIYRFFRVWNTDATENNETIIVATNTTDKDGPTDLLEEAHVQQSIRQKVVAWREQGKVSTEEAPVEYVVDVGVVPDEASHMFVDGVRSVPVVTTSRVMAFAIPPGQRKAASVPIPHPAPTPAPVAPALVESAPKRAREPEPEPDDAPVADEAPQPKKVRTHGRGSSKPKTGLVPFPKGDPFMPFSDTCPPALASLATDIDTPIDPYARELFDAMLAVSPNETDTPKCRYAHMSSAVNALRGKQKDFDFASAAIYAFMVLAGEYMRIDNLPDGSHAKGLCLCGRDLWKTFARGVRQYIPEIDDYLGKTPPTPENNTTMHLAFEMLAEMARHILFD